MSAPVPEGVRSMTPAGREVARALAALPPSTTEEVADRADVAIPTARSSLKSLVSRGLAASEKRETRRPGRNPTVWSSAGALDDDSGTGASEPEHGPRERVVAAMARAHFCRGLSSVRSKWVADAANLSSSKKAGSVLACMEEDGQAERVGGSTKTRWRLVAPADYAPFWGDS